VPFYLRPPNIERLKARGDTMSLVRASRYRDPEIAEQARALLAERMDHYIRQLDSKNLSVVAVARDALVAIGPPARDRLIFILGEGHAHRRQDAAFVLGRMGDPAAVEPLCAALKFPDPLLRRLAAEALGRIGDARAEKALKRMVALEPNPAVAKMGRKALSKLREPAG
jgi:HEAT repeat protein